MFVINDDNSIYVTRGDTLTFQLTAMENETTRYKFQKDEVVQFKIFEKKACDIVVLQKDFVIEEETDLVTIYLEEEETKLGDIISKPKDYWYEVTLNPDTCPQTIICYDEDGPKIFKLFPEGADIDELPIERESDFERVVRDTVIGWLEDGGAVFDYQIATAVKNYLAENPVNSGATEEEAKQIWQNRDDIAEIKRDIGDVELLLSGL